MLIAHMLTREFHGSDKNVKILVQEQKRYSIFKMIQAFQRENEGQTHYKARNHILAI
jgi:hypothetical protein